MNSIKKILTSLLVCATISGCATPLEMAKCFIGVSTKEIQDYRKDALVKVFDYDYNTCYTKVENVVKVMPQVDIYAKSKNMIAINYKYLNIDAVGLFFTAVDAEHTKVEISSASPDAKKWVAENVFSEKALPAKPVTVIGN